MCAELGTCSSGTSDDEPLEGPIAEGVYPMSRRKCVLEVPGRSGEELLACPAAMRAIAQCWGDLEVRRCDIYFRGSNSQTWIYEKETGNKKEAGLDSVNKYSALNAQPGAGAESASFFDSAIGTLGVITLPLKIAIASLAKAPVPSRGKFSIASMYYICNGPPPTAHRISVHVRRSKQRPDRAGRTSSDRQ